MIALTGNLGRDPELRYLADGKSVTSIALAVRGYRKDDTSWWHVSLFGQTAEYVSQYANKGDTLQVFGYFDADENGNPKTYTNKHGEIVPQWRLTGNQATILVRSKNNSGDGYQQSQKDQYSDIP